MTALRLVRLGAALLGAALCSCIGSAAQRAVSERVDAEIIAFFPAEGRRWTYEAENEVIIALDRYDAARDIVHELENRLETEDAVVEVISKRGGKGSDVHDAKVSWLKAKRDQAELEVSAAALAVYCARGNLELTKARLAVRFDLPVEETFVQPFEKQYEECARELEEARNDAGSKATETLEAKMKWRDARSGYIKQTSDFNHGLWID